jgi:hypothetical protein
MAVPVLCFANEGPLWSHHPYLKPLLRRACSATTRANGEAPISLRRSVLYERDGATTTRISSSFWGLIGAQVAEGEFPQAGSRAGASGHGLLELNDHPRGVQLRMGVRALIAPLGTRGDTGEVTRDGKARKKTMRAQRAQRAHLLKRTECALLLLVGILRTLKKAFSVGEGPQKSAPPSKQKLGTP